MPQRKSRRRQLCDQQAPLVSPKNRYRVTFKIVAEVQQLAQTYKTLRSRTHQRRQSACQRLASNLLRHSRKTIARAIIHLPFLTWLLKLSIRTRTVHSILHTAITLRSRKQRIARFRVRRRGHLIRKVSTRGTIWPWQTLCRAASWKCITLSCAKLSACKDRHCSRASSSTSE